MPLPHFSPLDTALPPRGNYEAESWRQRTIITARASIRVGRVIAAVQLPAFCTMTTSIRAAHEARQLSKEKIPTRIHLLLYRQPQSRHQVIVSAHSEGTVSNVRVLIHPDLIIQQLLGQHLGFARPG